MSLNIQGILDGLVSHALTTGYFESVNMHEPKSSPGNGLTAAIWIRSLEPLPSRSGLASTSGRVEFTLRIYQNMLSEPQDAIDPNVLKAADALLTDYSGDFGLGGVVAEIDLLGVYGTPLSAQSGYVSIDNKNFRALDITIPCVVNDIWNQAE